MDLQILTLNEKLEKATEIMEAEIKKLEDEIELELRIEIEAEAEHKLKIDK